MEGCRRRDVLPVVVCDDEVELLMLAAPGRGAYAIVRRGLFQDRRNGKTSVELCV